MLCIGHQQYAVLRWDNRDFKRIKYHNLSKWCQNPDILGFLNEDVQAEVSGMKTRLYTYQKHTMWKILQRELAPSLVESYEIVRLRAMDNSYYYYNQTTGAVTLEPTYILDIQGGIICEDMGTGKTCICLATIMATKDLSNPVDHHSHPLKSDYPKHALGVVPSLKETAANILLQLGINWKPIQHQLPSDVVDWFQKHPVFYEWTDIPSHYVERPRRVQPNFTTLAVYLSNATLVVVPDNLVAQWTGEIYKHIQDGQLRFLVYDDIKQKITSPITIADADLVLISQSRFSYENFKGGLDFNNEGHRLSSKNRQSELSSKLFSNWKWVCTGTPTQNLTESASMRTRQESQMDDLNRKLWNKLVSKPFLEGKPWAITKLSSIMERTMIRNQRVDMEQEVTLPPLHQTTVYLNFDYYQWIAHNCQIAMISLNAILSRREGPDYLFTAKNHKALRETVFNLWQSCLWHSVDLKLLKMAYENCVEKCLDVEQGISDYGDENEDLVNIREVLFHALEDRMFTCIMSQHSPSYVVQGLPTLFKETWGWLKGDHGAYEPLGSLPWDDHCVIGAIQIFEAMDAVIAVKNDEIKDLFVYNGSNQTLVSVHEFELRKSKKKHAEEMALKKAKKKKTHVLGKTLSGNDGNGSGPLAKKASYDRKGKDDEKKLQVDQEEQLTYYTRNAFSDARVLSSSSVKINYLVNQVYKYQSTEKCIIFSQQYNEMYEIYLALELARVRVLMYQDNKLNNAQRSQMILTFNTSDNANVIIMAVQKAAYGIDLSSATRVFFVSPVWQIGMEQQAIKRAHRIGQKNPVYIETLVIRNTIEDELLKRRDQVQTGDEVEEDKENLKRGDFFADSKLRNILNHAHFVPLPDSVRKNRETGEYQQKIVPLDAPLYLVPKKTISSEPKNTLGNDTIVTESSVQFSSAILPKQDYDISDIDVDETGDIEVEQFQFQNQTFTDAFESHGEYDQSSQSSNCSSQDDHDMTLDIVGDGDVTNHIQPWKMRLMDEQKRHKIDHSLSLTNNEKKRKFTKSLSPIAVQLQAKQEPSNPPKQKKKTVRFA
ncbi:SNF2 family N-terminal domain-containing protein [Parasitella parasitica]|nr:SNF2 family N-terminal domain-containing protein [Parasitella parasitica]